MKKQAFQLFLFSLIQLVIGTTLSAQVGINTDGNNPDESAMLEIKSTDRGVLIPRMSSGQRTSITLPAQGLLVYDSTTDGFWFFNGTIWESLNAGGLSSEITDANNDTKIQVEEAANEDIIRFDVAGTEIGKMDGKTFHLESPGQSLFIGKNAGINDDGQSRENIFIGEESGEMNTSGSSNVGLGLSSLSLNIDGIQNVAIGLEALGSNTSGDDNTGLGSFALIKNKTGNNNTAIGLGASTQNNSGNNNTSQGHHALYNNFSGNDNTGLGTESLHANITGSRNTAIGYKSDVAFANLINATAIGANTIVSQDSSLILGDNAKVGIGTSFPDTKLHIIGQIKIEDGNQSVGKILVSDANGLAKWEDPNILVPSTILPIPIRYQGTVLYVHPSDNGATLDWATAQDECSILSAFGFDDWYLPERLELDAMYKQSYLITGLSQVASVKYWSNTEQDINYAFAQRLDYGGPDPDIKTNSVNHNCRCIRKD